jgi:hypothetical protein
MGKGQSNTGATAYYEYKCLNSNTIFDLRCGYITCTGRRPWRAGYLWGSDGSGTCAGLMTKMELHNLVLKHGGA